VPDVGDRQEPLLLLRLAAALRCVHRLRCRLVLRMNMGGAMGGPDRRWGDKHGKGLFLFWGGEAAEVTFFGSGWTKMAEGIYAVGEQIKHHRPRIQHLRSQTCDQCSLKIRPLNSTSLAHVVEAGSKNVLTGSKAPMGRAEVVLAPVREEVRVRCGESERGDGAAVPMRATRARPTWARGKRENKEKIVTWRKLAYKSKTSYKKDGESICVSSPQSASLFLASSHYIFCSLTLRFSDENYGVWQLIELISLTSSEIKVPTSRGLERKQDKRKKTRPIVTTWVATGPSVYNK
jgi:hypothetical protein